MPVENIVWNWIVFLGECILLILAVILLGHALRWLRALLKRCMAVGKLKKAAHAGSYVIERHGLHWLALSKRRAETAFVLSRGEQIYHVHFVPTVGRSRALRFLAHDAYISEKEFGFLLLNTNKSMSLSAAQMFKPADVSSGGSLQWAHTETTAFPSGTIHLTGLERVAENRAQGIQDVVILNPAPMKAFAASGNGVVPIVGGEVMFGVAYHDIGSFCTLLRRG